MNPPIQNERLLATVNAWKSKLLDLSKRNRALNFKINKVSTVTIIDELPTEIFRLLCREKKSLKFKSGDEPQTLNDKETLETDMLFDESDVETQPTKNQLSLFTPYQTETLSANHTDDILQTNASAEHLDKSLRRIEEQARTIIEEQGINALFLALGMLHYKEIKDSEVVFKAPLILVPVDLVRKSAREGFTLKMTDEELIVNPSLIEYLQRNYAIALPEISDDENYDLQDFFQSVNQAIAAQSDWKVSNEIYLALFSFQKLVMYKDLEKNSGKVAAHKIFQQIINKQGDTFISLPQEIRELSLDKYFAPENCVQVVDADSSQLRAIATVSQNYDLVLEGPPGTGKSQTITNLIAQALSTGKSVLFVAEKMAALEVVYRRLCDVGLGEFCLELHSTKANKRSVMQDLKNTLDSSLQTVPPIQTATERLPVVRELLTNYVNAVHQPYGVLNISPYRAYGELDKVLDSPKMFFHADIFNAAETDLADVLREIDDLVAAAEFIGSPNKHAWRETTKTFYSENNLDEIKWTGTQILEKLKAFSIEAEKLESILGLPHLNTFADIETASVVASTIARSPGAPVSVLVSEAWNNAPPEAIDLIETGRKIVELRKRIEQNFTAQIFEQEPSNEISYIEKKSQGFFSFLAFFDSRYRAVKKHWLSLRLPSYDASIIEQANEMKFVAEYLHRQSDLKAQAQLGAELLRDFLMYAEHKRLDSPIVSAINETESPFEREVFEELSRRGLALIPQVGASGYRIDFGVLDDTAQGKFICGIECDGVSYHSSETARDRDRLRQQVLEGRGWAIHRVWSTDWFKDRNEQIERLLTLIEQSRERAKRESDQETERQTFLESEAEQQARDFLGDLSEMEIGNIFENLEQKNYVRPTVEPYQMAQIDREFSFQSLLEASDQQIAKVIMAIVEQEAPIHIKDIFTRTASVWGQKAGSNISARITNVLRLMERAKLIEIRGEFVWKIDGKLQIRSRKGTNVPAERIAPEEIRELILLILRDGHKFNKQNLINEVRTMFGFSRTGASLQQAIKQVIDDLLSEGLLGEGSTGIGLRT